VRVKTSLDHLPEAKRRDLERALEILFRSFEEVTRNKTSPRRWGSILKMVLYGSYARGDWVDDPVGGYKSDYDLLVVVSSEELTDLAEYWGEADEKLLQAYQITHELTAPAHFIVHSLEDVNRRLTRGRPFFVDIVRDGIALYETPEHPFAKPTKLSPEEALQEAQANFDQWFPSASGFLDTARYAASQGRPVEAAFQLHQATERLYHCILLTETLYSPKSHKLNFLRSQAERVAPELIAAWPRGDRFEKRCWELLRRAYVEARYSPHYKVTDNELAWLMERIEDLQRRVETSCREYLERTRPKG
jgi:predicted nucleotidyltransferase/HEPN domain-containing protein